MPRNGKTPSSHKFEHRDVKVTLSPRRERWRADFYVPVPSGKAPRYAKSFTSLEEAKAAAIAVIDNAVSGIDVRTAHELTVDGLGRLYIKEWHELRGSSKSTIQNVSLAFRRLSPILGQITLENLTATDVVRARETFRAEGLSVGSRQNYQGALRWALNWAMTKHVPPIVSINVAALVPMPMHPKGRKRMYIPSSDVMAQVLDLQLSLPGTKEALLHEVISEFLSETGSRMGECLGLEWGDIDRDALTVTLHGSDLRSKNATSYRTITIDKNLLASLDRLLSRWTGNHSKVFVKQDGIVISGDAVRRRLAAIGKHLDLPETLHPHLFRHYHASRLLADGLGLHHVKDRLGHSDIKLTSNLYGHLQVGDGRAMVDAVNQQLRNRRRRPAGFLNAEDAVDAVEDLLRTNDALVAFRDLLSSNADVRESLEDVLDAMDEMMADPDLLTLEERKERDRDGLPPDANDKPEGDE